MSLRTLVVTAPDFDALMRGEQRAQEAFPHLRVVTLAAGDDWIVQYLARHCATPLVVLYEASNEGNRGLETLVAMRDALSSAPFIYVSGEAVDPKVADEIIRLGGRIFDAHGRHDDFRNLVSLALDEIRAAG